MRTLLTSEVFIFGAVSTEEFGVRVVLNTPAGPVTVEAAPTAPPDPTGPVGPVIEEAAPATPWLPWGPVGPTVL